MTIEILAYETTPLGTLCLRRRELVSKPGTLVTEVTLNHEFLMSSYLTQSERCLTDLGLKRVCQRLDSNEEISVMVGGLGLGYTAAEALKSELVSRVKIVEFLPEVIGWLKDGLIPLSETLLSDQRFEVTLGDVYARLGAKPDEVFDLIAIDVDHSPQDVLGEQSGGFYSESGLRQATKHLKKNGVLGVWSYAEDTPLLTAMQKVFVDVEVEKVTVWNDLIDVEQTDWLFFGRKREIS